MGLRFLNECFIAESLIKKRRGADTYFGQMTSHPELITEQVITSGLPTIRPGLGLLLTRTPFLATSHLSGKPTTRPSEDG
jgi:hypothetical protein